MQLKQESQCSELGFNTVFAPSTLACVGLELRRSFQVRAFEVSRFAVKDFNSSCASLMLPLAGKSQCMRRST